MGDVLENVEKNTENKENIEKKVEVKKDDSKKPFRKPNDKQAGPRGHGQNQQPKKFYKPQDPNKKRFREDGKEDSSGFEKKQKFDSDFRRRQPRKKECYFKKNKITKIDFKDVELLRRFVTDRGKILPRRITGTSTKYQRKLTIAIKRARHMALLPFVKE